jgi:3-deoxy-7-phosphoheptulonate synthase
MDNSTTQSSLVLLLDASATVDERDEVMALARDLNLVSLVASGDGWSAIAIGDGAQPIDRDRFKALRAVERAIWTSAPYRLCSRDTLGRDSQIALKTSAEPLDPNALRIGGGVPLILGIAPVTLTGTTQDSTILEEIIRSVGPRIISLSNPGSAHNELSPLRVETLKDIREMLRDLDVALSVEISDVGEMNSIHDLADILEVKHTQMQDFRLLTELGRLDRPVLLRRGFGATVEEFLLAAEYMVANGNGRVILCESGPRRRDSSSEHGFQINVIPLLKQLSHLPVLAEPATATSLPALAGPVARAAIAAGADGVMLDARINSHSDKSPEAPMTLEACVALAKELDAVGKVIGRRLSHGNLQAHRLTYGSLTTNGTSGAAARHQRAKDPMQLLHRTEGTLARVIEDALDISPHLHVVRQQRVQPPFPSWLTWLLQPEGDLLVRWTRYEIGATVLSRNLAYVDIGRVDAPIVERLESKELNLGQLFETTDIRRFGFEFGTGGTAGPIHWVLREGHTDTKTLHPYVWRRYIGATGGRTGFLVVECLPSLSWRRLLESSEERVRFRKASVR